MDARFRGHDVDKACGKAATKRAAKVRYGVRQALASVRQDVAEPCGNARQAHIKAPNCDLR
jgi:hypothetical protein